MNEKDEKIIATLGPEGTCSEKAAQYYINKIEGICKIKLFSSFEEAITSLKDKRTTMVIIPSAYGKLADIIFREKDYVRIVDTFLYNTPEVVFATDSKDKVINSIATQSSPKSLLVDKYYEEAFIDSYSNSRSAQMVMEGLADACVTTMICAKRHSMNIIENFGSVNMGWNVFSLKED